jgi:hypothetical protein
VYGAIPEELAEIRQAYERDPLSALHLVRVDGQVVAKTTRGGRGM